MYSIANTIYLFVLYFSFISTVQAYNRNYNFLGQIPGGMYGPSKRDGGPFNNTTLQAPQLIRRQDGSSEQIYYLSSTMSYMATPYGSCTGGAVEDSLCPTDYLCVCQTPGSSRCLPTVVATATDCMVTPYAGLSIQPLVTRWSLLETDTYMAEPWGQCGGTTPTVGTPWNAQQTACPAAQVCACEQAYYSQCTPIESAAISGTACPNNPWLCSTDPNVTPPPPTATAELYSQCGGRCWSGATNCPDGASCWTETSPDPGGYAMCDYSRPVDGRYKMKLKGRGAALNVPARVAAQATPIAF